MGGGTFLCAAEEAVIMFEGRETENGRGGGRGTGGRDPAEFSPSLDVCDGINGRATAYFWAEKYYIMVKHFSIVIYRFSQVCKSGRNWV